MNFFTEKEMTVIYYDDQASSFIIHSYFMTYLWQVREQAFLLMRQTETKEKWFTSSLRSLKMRAYLKSLLEIKWHKPTLGNL